VTGSRIPVRRWRGGAPRSTRRARAPREAKENGARPGAAETRAGAGGATPAVAPTEPRPGHCRKPRPEPVLGRRAQRRGEVRAFPCPRRAPPASPGRRAGRARALPVGAGHPPDAGPRRGPARGGAGRARWPRQVCKEDVAALAPGLAHALRLDLVWARCSRGQGLDQRRRRHREGPATADIGVRTSKLLRDRSSLDRKRRTPRGLGVLRQRSAGFSPTRAADLGRPSRSSCW
jgi:hypothetical protein